MTAQDQQTSRGDTRGDPVRVPPLARTARPRRRRRRRFAGRDRGRPVHAAVLRPAGRCADARRLRSGGAARGDDRVRRHRGAGRGVDDAAADRPAGDRAVHAEDHVGRVARRLHARAALLDRLARQQLCRLDRAQDHPRHVGARPAQRHHPDGAGAVADGAAGLDDPARAALALARRGHRGRHADLCLDDDGVLGELHRAGGARLQRLGHQGRRHAGGCADLQRGGEILRRGSARGCAAGRRHRPLAHARAADLAALQLYEHGAARGAAVLSRERDRRRDPAVDRRAAPRRATSPMC